MSTQATWDNIRGFVYRGDEQAGPTDGTTFVRQMNMFLESKGVEPICEECSGLGGPCGLEGRS